MDTTHVHFIGIGGSGLSAIARLLLESGVKVSGSDRAVSPLAERLMLLGAQVYVGHRAENVDGATLVVRSSAVTDENVEVQAAQERGVPVLKRADFLGQWMDDGRTGIAIAGTHGKTTTTAMVAWMLHALGQDPSYIIGGVSANLGNNAHAGQGPHFVIEADEYDRMFLGLRPTIAVVTNVEHDHPDCYPTAAAFYAAFLAFAGRLSPQGTLLACSDDPGAAQLLAEVKASGQKALAYGTEGSAPLAYAARNARPNARGGYDFELAFPQAQRETVSVSLQAPGLHNVRNACAALGVADLLGLNLATAAAALGEFRGTGRRFELRGEAAGVTVIDDYAHHPTEIRATLAGARARFPQRRVWAVWQPHTYSRTRTLLPQFIGAFGDADRVLVTEIFAAREPAPADGFSARQVVAAMSGAEYAADLGAAHAILMEHLEPGDVLLVLSAGDADRLSGEVLASLKERSHA